MMVFMVCAQLFAEDLELKSIQANIGKSAITSGYDITLSFAGQNRNFRVTGNQSRVYIVYQLEDKWHLKTSASGGFYKNMPWAGPLVIFSPTKFLSTMHWYGVSAGNPDLPAWNMRVMFCYNDIAFSFKGFRFAYALFEFMDEGMKSLPGIGYSGKINSSWSFSISTDYNVDDHEPLFQFGLKQTF